jgi:hypothetical protein
MFLLTKLTTLLTRCHSDFSAHPATNAEQATDEEIFTTCSPQMKASKTRPGIHVSELCTNIRVHAVKTDFNSLKYN